MRYWSQFKTIIVVCGFLLCISGNGCGQAFQVKTLSDADLANSGSQTILGKDLYADNCASCHGGLGISTKKSRTSAQIEAAIASVPVMQFLRAKLSRAQIEAIAGALSPQSTSPVANPFACNATADPGRSELRRLSKAEYRATLQDLLGGAVSLTEIQDQLNGVPEEITGKENLFDTNKLTASQGHVMGYFTVAKRVGDLVGPNQAKIDALFGNDACTKNATLSDQCLTKFIGEFGLRAFRRPLKSTEMSAYLALARAEGDRDGSLRSLLTAFLMSPSFLYRVEIEGAPVNGSATLFTVSPYELASRLSYTIWGTMPDGVLFAAAAAGSLNTDAGLTEQVERMFASPKARARVQHFYRQWLGINRVPDFASYSGGFLNGINTSGLRDEVIQEMHDIMDLLIWQTGGNYKDLLTTDIAFVRTDAMAAVYGAQRSTAADGRMQLQDPNRRGILTRAGFLASGSDQNHPILRGSAIRSHILCDKLGAPDPSQFGADALKPPPPDPRVSTRELYTRKTSPVACAQCHNYINPLGFAFEQFDALGRFRTRETVSDGQMSYDHNIDARVVPIIYTETEPMVDGVVQLQSAIASGNKGSACMVQQWFEFSNGRVMSEADGCSLSKMYDALTGSGGNMLKMFKTITADRQFRLKKIQN